jgi:hypothetical protein
VREDQTKNLILGGLVYFIFYFFNSNERRGKNKQKASYKGGFFPLLILKEGRNEELLGMLSITEWKVVHLATECSKIVTSKDFRS